MSHREKDIDRSEQRPRVALITGASSGIGAGLAIRRAQRGENLILMARREAELEDVATRARDLGAEVEICPVDVTDEEAVARSISAAKTRLGPVDLLIANAGMGIPTPAHRFDPAVFKRVVDVNLYGVVNCISAILPEMITRDAGQIVGVASLAGSRGLPGSSAYCASKAAMRALLESLRIDLRGSGVKVTTINPGFIKTPMTGNQKMPMPFIMDLEPALDKMDAAIERKASEYAFPFPLSTIVRTARFLPNGVYDAVMGKANRRG